ncbi:hypothetical protein TNIN_305511 [Trichonephila inaurata madagascariensis]|uniref:Uncharacterized protein n=1 Tax=Trichonephila inaurata madagascariensis TaxID=2747483 RepID=A0A8X6X2D3_9ARAC|nr:hypothetical protein TNIN_305511 [Trichonephila inaurata madagascariensis]
MITTLRNQTHKVNTTAFVEMVKQRTIYKDLSTCVKKRPGITYSQAAGTSNSKSNQQMAPHHKETPAALVTNQANQSSPLIPPPTVNNTNRT